MRRLLRILLLAVVGLVVVLAAVAGGVAFWAVGKRDALLAQSFEVPPHDVPMPFPLTEEELTALRAEKMAAMTVPALDPTDPDAVPFDPLAGVDLEALALERAVARGKHLIQARYACILCHGSDLGGGTMIDDPMIGTLKGPNLTKGQGGVVGAYTMVDWDRKVRHGVNPNTHPGFMPSLDFFRMSDQELSDLVVYVEAQPPIDRVIEPVRYGPLGTFLVATGQIPLSANLHPGHDIVHLVEPPPEGPTPEFGAHLSGICTGCHRENFAGGPVRGGDPAWPPAANLTPHEQGLAAWTYDNFVKLMRSGIRPDGTPTRVPMAEVLPLGNAMTDVEMQALWAYIRSLPPTPDGT